MRAKAAPRFRESSYRARFCFKCSTASGRNASSWSNWTTISVPLVRGTFAP